MVYLMLKTLHVAAAFALFASLGATMLGGSRKQSASILHGISMLAILIIGFAMLKRPPMDQFWWMAKLGIWIFIGIAPALVKKRILPPTIVLTLSLIAAFGAAYLGLYKPF